MSAKAGLKEFGDKGAASIMQELEQLLYRKVIVGCKASSLTSSQRKAALQYLMFLKEKRCGKVKARGCADGRKQRLYKTKEETSSPTMNVEALFITCIIDAMERREAMTCDIPGAFMQLEMDELVHMKLEGEIALLLIRLDPSYKQILSYHHGKPVIYTELNKVLYGTLQAALLFWRNLSGFLVEKLGFEANPYDFCVVNKIINGSQCTIRWHVDDLKIAHIDGKVNQYILETLQKEYGKEAQIPSTTGKVHEYLGMTIDYSTPGKVVFRMEDYIDRLIKECPNDLLKGNPTSPAANHLFEINPDCEKLSSAQADEFHHLVAKLLYLAKRTRPDILLAVAFLCTRVKGPDMDDYKKLGRCLSYIRCTKELRLTLEAKDMSVIHWWIDASFAVHADYKSHTGACLSFGRGWPVNISSKQKINMRSSTEAELVGINNTMALVLWCRLFIMGQGFDVRDNIVYQDNQSTMLLSNNGRHSSGKKPVISKFDFILLRITSNARTSVWIIVPQKPWSAISIRNHCKAVSSENFMISSLTLTMINDRLGHRSVLGHLVRPRSPELNQMVLRYVLHRHHHHYHVRMPLWLLVEQQPTVHAHLLGVNVAK